LKAELKDKTKDMRGRIEPLPVVKPYEPVPYKAFDQPDPFSTRRSSSSPSRRAPAAGRASSRTSTGPRSRSKRIRWSR